MLLFPAIDEQKVTGRRARVPLSLVYSRHHSPLAVAAYGLLDIMGTGRSRGPCEARREWLAERLDASVSGVAKALGALMSEHGDPGSLLAVPAFLVSTRRGHGRSAVREVLPGVPWVDVPEWTLGDESGPLVSHKAWRYYAVLLHKRTASGRVGLSRRDLGALLRARADTITQLNRELAAAGLVLVEPVAGGENIITPITDRDDAERAAAYFAWLSGCGLAVDNEAATCGNAVDDGASAGTSPDPDSGTSPHPDSGTSMRSPDLGSPDLGSPVVGRPGAPAPTASPRVPPAGVGKCGPVVVTLGDVVAWCGRCDGPRTRRAIDPDTGFAGGPCPSCSSTLERAA